MKARQRARSVSAGSTSVVLTTEPFGGKPSMPSEGLR
jgi:hypothetical protein